MKKFLSYAAGHPSTFEEFCYFAHDYGFKGVEFIPDLSPNLPEELTKDRRASISKIGKELELTFTVHNIFYDINHTSLVPKVRDLAFEITEDVISFAKHINALHLVIHAGYRFAAWRTKPEQIKMFENVVINAYTRLAQLSCNYDIPILMENGNYFLSGRNGKRGPLHIGITPDELVNLVEIPKPNFGICFDIGKAYFSVADYSINELIGYLPIIKNHICEIHLNAFDGYKEAVPPVLEWLKFNKNDIPIVFECGKQSIEPLLEITRDYVD